MSHAVPDAVGRAPARGLLPPGWPNAAASRFLKLGDAEIHYQVLGEGPVLLMLHGTGASVHSWRGLLPLLTPHYRVIALDLPGHGFSASPPPGAYTPRQVGDLVRALLDALGAEPELIVGHSAGAVVACQMILDTRVEPKHLVALNPALLPPLNLQLPFFRFLARSFAATDLVPTLVARRAQQATVRSLLRSVGSPLDRQGVALYSELLSRPEHVRGALRLMSEWDLEGLVPRLKRLPTATLVVSGRRDAAVPPSAINRVRVHLPGARYEELPTAGHLAHEEMPEHVSRLILNHARGITTPS